MILVIDNYDSFTYNLVQYLGEMGEELRVFRNDKITLEEIEALKPSHIVISPGPGVPADAGIIREDVIEYFHKSTPILGVCLGHQAIGEVFGGKIVRAPSLMHGKDQPDLSRRQDDCSAAAAGISGNALSLAGRHGYSAVSGSQRRNEGRHRHGTAASGVSDRRNSVSSANRS